VVVEAYVSVRPALQGSLHQIVGSTGEAEDLVQITFLKLFDQLRKNTEIRELRGWLYKVAHNLAIDSLRTRGREESTSTEWLDERSTPGDSAEQNMIRKQQVRQILGEIQRATGAAVMTTEQGTKQAVVASRQVSEAGETIRSLADAAGKAAQASAQIVASAGQQALGMEQIRLAVGNIHQATEQNLTASRQAEQAAQDLTRLGEQLTRLVGSRRAPDRVFRG
jgi:methyl-accepting chemotaxis protein